jgi:hypothetical protein
MGKVFESVWQCLVARILLVVGPREQDAGCKQRVRSEESVLDCWKGELVEGDPADSAGEDCQGRIRTRANNREVLGRPGHAGLEARQDVGVAPACCEKEHLEIAEVDR